MFGRGKQTKQFDLEDYPEINAMLQRAYNEGCADQLAKVRDLRDEVKAELAAPHSHYLDALDEVIERLES